MHRSFRQRQPRGRRARWATAWGIVVALAFGTAWSCSVEKNYAVLSFFFDGVPDPNAKEKPGPGGVVVVDIKKSPTYSIHKPFQEDQCTACHTTTFELGTADSALCLKCHAEKQKQYPKMHGPVAAGACLWCHTPHESAQAHLLKKEARDVCSQCHEVALLGKERVPEHGDATKSCVECHSGHGGNASYFLIPAGGRVPPPATAPEPTPR